METRAADLVVVGAGPGGYVAAIRGAQLGLETLVVEDGQVGGVCLNWGCVPSKALIEAAGTYHRLRKEIPAMGIEVGGAPTLDVARMQAWKDGLVKKLTGGVRTLLKGNGVALVVGRARLVGPRQVEVATPAGPLQVEARKGVILATGAEPSEVPGLAPDGTAVITAKEAVSLREIPRRLAVVGGGVIGLELGTVYRKLGSEVTVVELLPTILPGFDPDVIATVGRRLRQLKLKTLTGARVRRVARTGAGLSLSVEQGEQEQEIEVDQVLVAAGMVPRSREVGVEALGVELDSRGFISVDRRCQTNLPGLYAIGDLTGAPMLAHKASFEGEVAAEAIADHGDRTRDAAIPGAVFTDPEIGTVGLTEPQAIAAGREVKVGKFHFAAAAKSLVLQEPHGLVKVVADQATDRVLGVHIVGAHASDLLAEATVAVEQGLSVRSLGHVVHAHPTLSELVAEAALDADNRAIHAVRK